MLVRFILFITGLSILTLATSSFAQSSRSTRPPRVTATHFTIEPFMAWQSGHTKYRLNISDTQTRIISELDFPLDHPMLGARATLQLIGQGTPLWRFEAYVARSISAPSGLMTDSDWSHTTIFFNGLWSYTESIPEGSMWDYGVVGTYHLINRTSHAFGPTVGLRQQSIHQEIDNFEGFQIVGPARDRIEFSETDLPAIEYDVTYLMPEVGLAGMLQVSGDLRLSSRVIYSFIHASDKDDHLLRKKESKASGNGKAVSLALSGTYSLPLAIGGRPLAFSSDISLLSLRVDGHQTQRFYETVTEYDPVDGVYYIIPAGTVLGPIPYQFSSTQFRVGGSLSLRF